MNKPKPLQPAPFWWHEDAMGTDVRLGLFGRRLYAAKSRFQEVSVLDHDFLGRVLILDDVVQTTEADEFIYHEMLVHVPLCGMSDESGKARRSVLIIGGGDGGTLREVLRHQHVQRVVMVEIDQAVVDASTRFVGIQGNYEDPRVDLRVEDGCAYVRSQEAQTERFDLVLLDSTDPIGPGEPLFTKAFVQDVARCLDPKGVMVRHVGVPFFQKELLEQGVRSMRQVFASVDLFRASVPTYLGGDMAFVAGTMSEQSLRVPNMAMKGRYYNEEVHVASFAMPTWWKGLVEGIS